MKLRNLCSLDVSKLVFDFPLGLVQPFQAYQNAAHWDEMFGLLALLKENAKELKNLRSLKLFPARGDTHIYIPLLDFIFSLNFITVTVPTFATQETQHFFSQSLPNNVNDKKNSLRKLTACEER